jgi:hypothetical protein
LIARSAPYTQRVIVLGKTLDEVYDAVNLWLSENRCSVTRREPPTLIDARHGVKNPVYHFGSKDNYQKAIEVRLSSLGEDVLLYVTFKQENDSMGNSGYVFWGVKLRELYETIGVNVNDSIWSALMPAGILKEEIDGKIRLFATFMIVSALLIGYLWTPYTGYAVLYAIWIMIPRGLLAVWDIREHIKLREISKATYN